MADKEKKKSSVPLADSKYRSAVSYFLSFLLALLLLFGTVCVIAQVGVFSEKAFFKNLDDEYYAGVVNAITEAAKDYTIPTGIGTEVIDGVFENDEVFVDVRGYITAAFKGKEYSPDFTKPNARLRANVERFFDENEVEIYEDKRDIIEAYIKDIDNVYVSEAKMPGIELIMSVRSRYINIFIIGSIVSFVLAALLILLIIKLYHMRHRAMRFIAYALGGTALMAFAAPFALYVSKVYYGVQLTPKYFYNFAISLIDSALVACMYSALAWFVIMLACIAFIVYKRYKVTKASYRHS